MKARRCFIAACALASVLGAIAAGNSPAATTALSVDVIGPARSVLASDGLRHIDYDLLITNAFVGDVKLESLTVRSGNRVLQRLEGEELAAHVHPILRESVPVQTIEPSSTVIVILDVTLPRQAALPKRLTHDISYSLPNDSPANAVIDSRTVRGASVAVQSRAPMVIPPPLRGSGWWVGGGCCDPNQRHRAVTLSNDEGRVIPNEMFDIDWLQLADGRMFSGDGTQLTDYPGYGAKVYSVSGGTVTKVIDGKPEAPLTGGPNPAVLRAEDFGGNTVIVRIGRNRFAFYAHFVPQSIRVHVGQRVRPGQVLGLLGNSGNSAAPHLHFGIHNGPDPETSASLPWVFPSYEYLGSGDVTPEGDVPLTGTPGSERRSYPLNLASLVLR
jgi:hypothetical protein